MPKSWISEVLALCMICLNCNCFEFQRLTSFEDNGFGVEVVLFIILFLTILNFVHGKAQNKKVAVSFFSEVLETLYENFAVLGENNNETILVKTNKTDANASDNADTSNINRFLSLEEMSEETTLNTILDEDSSYYYRLFCTGRKNIKWAFVDVQTKRRQDLITNLFYSLVMPENDKVSIELKLENKEVKPCLCEQTSRNRPLMKSLKLSCRP